MDTPLNLHVLYTGIASIFRWLKASRVSIACEEKMRDIARSALGDNLKGEIAPFSFPMPSGGIQIKKTMSIYNYSHIWHI